MSDGENSLPLSVSLAGLTQWLRHRRQTAASLWLPLFAIWKPVTSLPQTGAAALSGCLLGLSVCLSACQSFSWAVSNWILASMLIARSACLLHLPPLDIQTACFLLDSCPRSHSLRFTLPSIARLHPLSHNPDVLACILYTVNAPQAPISEQ